MTRKERTINIALWIAQASLSAFLLFSGIVKLTQPSQDIAALWLWTEQHQEWIKPVGVVEIILGLFLLFSELLHLALKVRLWSALAVMGWMLIYSIILLLANDAPSAGANLIYFLLAAGIAWGRSKQAYTTPG